MLSLVTVIFPFLLDKTISMSPAKSSKTCRQAPQGGINSILSEFIAIALNFLSPFEIALKIAVRSAQMVKLNELFSILHPV